MASITAPELSMPQRRLVKVVKKVIAQTARIA
jgi:hypothetical protein